MSYQLARQTVYALKRLHALSLDVYFAGTPTTNAITGAMTAPATKVRVKKAVLFPSSEAREARYNRTYIRWSVGFAYGAYHDAEERAVLIDLTDLSGRIPTCNDWVIIRHERYEIKSVKMHEEARAVGLGLIRVAGAPTYEYHDVVVKDELSLSDGVVES